MTLDYKNSAMHYTVSGDGPVVILLHGFLETITMWNEIAQELSKTNKVVCIDLLGHGETDCLGYVHTMEAMADAVFAVISHLKIKKAYVIGHSMGGYVALALADIKPELFTGLCLMNSTFEADDSEKQRIRTRAIKMAQTNYKNLVRLSFANLFAPESSTKFKADYDSALKIALQTSVQGYIAAQEGMKARPNRFNVLKNLKGRKRILIGKKDTLVNSKYLIEQLKNTTIDFTIFSEGHMSHIENKYDLSYIIKRFVEK
jgi:pimeloyl-ACP methyl ester carboxylesterase